mgnify:CR=1 FL=1
MTYLPNYESKVCTAYIYERLHDALDSDDLAQEISNLYSELACNFEKATGTKIGVALGWDKGGKS